MKKLIILLFSLLISEFSFNIDNCHAQWVQTYGIWGGNANSFTVNGSNIFAGTNDSGVYLSTNNGANWAHTALNNIFVWSLTTLGNNIFTGTNGSGVYLSTNSGTSWTQTSLNNKAVFSLTTLGNNIFAGTSVSGVYLSTNNGTSWTQTALNDKSVHSLVTLGNNIFAGTFSYGVYLSTNNGTSWTQTTLNNQFVYSLATIGNNIFAGVGSSNGVYLSTNNGTNWTQTSLNNHYVWSLAVSGNNIFAGTDFPGSGSGGVYLSTNNGTSWIQKNQGFSGIPSVYGLLIANNYIFAGTAEYSVCRRFYSEIIGIKQISELVPASYSLQQNYPNPFNPTTNIRYDIPKGGLVRLVVFDALGRELETLVNENQSPGTYEEAWNASQYTSGVYFARLESGSYKHIIKMLMVK